MLNRKAEDTANIMREANRNLYHDKRLIEKIIESENKLSSDLERASKTVVEIERLAFYRKMTMYGVVVLLGLLIILMLFRKLFY